MSRPVLVSLMIVVSLGRLPAMADITTYTDQAGFQSQLTTLHLANFDGFTGVLTNQYSAEGATFTPLGSSSLQTGVDPYDGSPHQSSPNVMFCAGGVTGNAEPWQVTFSSPVSGVSMWFWNLYYTDRAVAKFYGEGDVLLGTYDLAAFRPANWTDHVWGFAGFISSSADIVRMDLTTPTTTANQILYDDFQWGTASTVVPAPGAALLACIGLGLVGWVKRRLA